MRHHARHLAQLGTVVLITGALSGSGCHSESAPAPATAPGSLSGDASAVDPDVRAYAAALQTDLVAARTLDASALAAQHELPFAASVGYDPMQAQGMDAIQGSALKLQGSELSALSQHGFAISSRQQYPTFTYAYATIYSQDLPVYISADSILDALHSSYQALLKDFETTTIG